jgi:hypothetical protein
MYFLSRIFRQPTKVHGDDLNSQVCPSMRQVICSFSPEPKAMAFRGNAKIGRFLDFLPLRRRLRLRAKRPNPVLEKTSKTPYS